MKVYVYKTIDMKIRIVNLTQVLNVLKNLTQVISHSIYLIFQNYSVLLIVVHKHSLIQSTNCFVFRLIDKLGYLE